MHHLERGLLARYREAVAGERGETLGAAVAAVRAAGYDLGGSALKRVPSGFDPEHERADLLRHDGLYGWLQDKPAPAETHDRRFPAYCAERLRPLSPLQEWLLQLL
jgi:hypothetical protein